MFKNARFKKRLRGESFSGINRSKRTIEDTERHRVSRTGADDERGKKVESSDDKGRLKNIIYTYICICKGKDGIYIRGIGVIMLTSNQERLDRRVTGSKKSKE